MLVQLRLIQLVRRAWSISYLGVRLISREESPFYLGVLIGKDNLFLVFLFLSFSCPAQHEKLKFIKAFIICGGEGAALKWDDSDHRRAEVGMRQARVGYRAQPVRSPEVISVGGDGEINRGDR
jgi:hypothetical protein